MIQPEELMINNYVKDPFGEIIKIEFIDPINDTCGNIEIGDISFDSLYPIELTENILIRLGFEKYTFKVENKNQNTSDILFKIEIGTKQWMIITCQNNFGFSFPMLKDENSNNHYYLNGISYLHQLQNLVSVLTGKQLTLKEEE